MKKRLLSFALTLCMVLCLLPVMSLSAFAAPGATSYVSTWYTNEINEIMAFGYTSYETESAYVCNTPGNFDIQGFFAGGWKRTTYSDSGFYTYLTTVEPPSYNGLMDANVLADGTFHPVTGTSLEVRVTASLIANGAAVQITYDVKNISATAQSFSIGSFADVMIGSDDSAEITLINPKCFSMVSSDSSDLDDDEDSPTYGEYARFNFFGADVPGYVTDVDTCWFGGWSYADDNLFESTEEDSYSGDSGMAYSWTNETVVAGATNTYSVILTIGGSESSDITNLLKIRLDEEYGIILNFKPGNSYTITDGTSIWDLAVSEAGEYVLSLAGVTVDTGNVNDGVPLLEVWYGKSLTVTEVSEDGASTVIDATIKVGDEGKNIRNEAPAVPSVAGGTYKITITAEEGQQYIIYNSEDKVVKPWFKPGAPGPVIVYLFDCTCSDTAEHTHEYKVMTRIAGVPAVGSSDPVLPSPASEATTAYVTIPAVNNDPIDLAIDTVLLLDGSYYTDGLWHRYTADTLTITSTGSTNNTLTSTASETSLILDGLSVSSAASCIFADGPLNIIIKGENSLMSSGDSAIFAGGELTFAFFDADGSTQDMLTASGSPALTAARLDEIAFSDYDDQQTVIISDYAAAGTAVLYEDVTAYNTLLNLVVNNKVILEDGILTDNTDWPSGVSFDASTRTLTLSGTIISDPYETNYLFETFGAGIYADGDLNVVLAEGSESKIDIASAADSQYYIGIFCLGDLSFSGTGSLECRAAKPNYSYSVYSLGNVDIMGGNISFYSDGEGLWLVSGDLTISGGDLVINAAGDGIYLYYGDLDISGGDTDIIAEDDGVSLDYGSMTVSGGVLNIEGTYGIYLYSEDLTISGGNVDIDCGYSGIYLDNGDILFSGGSLTIQVENEEYAYPAMLAEDGGISFTGGSIIAESASGAMYVGTEITFGSGYGIKVPSGGVLGEYEGMNTVLNGEDPAIRVELGRLAPPSYFVDDSSDWDRVEVNVSGSTLMEKTSVSVYGSTATLQAPSASNLEAVAAAAAEDNMPVQIDLSSLQDNLTSVVIPNRIVTTVAGSGAAGLTITMPEGSSVNFDAQALDAVSEQAGSEDIRLVVEEIAESSLTEEQKAVVAGKSDEALIIDASLYRGNEKITDFKGGMATISIPYSMPEGARSVEVYFISDDGTVTKYDAVYVDGLIRFTIDHFSVYMIDPLETEVFSDVSKSDWFYDDVLWVYNRGLMAGIGGKSFAPEMDTTRGMIVTILWRLENKPLAKEAMSFTDVAEGEYYREAVEWAAENKIVEGYNSLTYAPKSPITREQMVAILWRYAKYKGYDVSIGKESDMQSFKDAEHVSTWAVPAMQWACGADLIKGDNGNLLPQGSATRSQVAAILHRFIVEIK